MTLDEAIQVARDFTQGETFDATSRDIKTALLVLADAAETNSKDTERSAMNL